MMCNSGNLMFSFEDDGVLGLPIYLLIAILISVTIIAIFLVSLATNTSESQSYAVEHEINMMVSQATTMYDYADDGSVVSVHVNFPSSMRFIVFGGLPQNGSEQPANLSLNMSTSNNYYYVMVDGSIHTGRTTACLSSENSSKVALFRSGSYKLTLELVREGDAVYVKIY